MATRESLEKLIEFISELASQNGKAWFAEKLVRKISDPDAQPITRRTLYEMHERCIADIIKAQANGFYANLKLNKIKPRLIDNYCQMERHRRNDDFEEFCESLFEQLELISRTLFTKKEKETVIKIHKEGALCGKKIGQLIFFDASYDPQSEYYKSHEKAFKKEPSEWGIEFQICAVLYTHYYKTPHPMQLNCEQFLVFKGIIKQLALIRNANSHPGGTFSETQKLFLEKLVANKHRNYINYLEFLEDFTRTINTGFN